MVCILDIGIGLQSCQDHSLMAFIYKQKIFAAGQGQGDSFLSLFYHQFDCLLHHQRADRQGSSFFLDNLQSCGNILDLMESQGQTLNQVCIDILVTNPVFLLEPGTCFVIQFVQNQLGHSNFSYPVFIKKRPNSGIDFLGKYRVTKVEVSLFV